MTVIIDGSFTGLDPSGTAPVITTLVVVLVILVVVVVFITAIVITTIVLYKKKVCEYLIERERLGDLIIVAWPRQDSMALHCHHAVLYTLFVIHSWYALIHSRLVAQIVINLYYENIIHLSHVYTGTGKTWCR